MGHDGFDRYTPDELLDSANRLITDPAPPMLVADPIAPSGYKFNETEDQSSIEAQIAAKQEEAAQSRIDERFQTARSRTIGLITKAAIEQAQALMNPKIEVSTN